MCQASWPPDCSATGRYVHGPHLCPMFPDFRKNVSFRRFPFLAPASFCELFIFSWYASIKRITEEFRITPTAEYKQQYRRIWLQHINRMQSSGLPRHILYVRKGQSRGRSPERRWETITGHWVCYWIGRRWCLNVPWLSCAFDKYVRWCTSYQEGIPLVAVK
jgi:hypothetical protein